MLSEFNPSLAWLPLLSEMKLIQSERQLIAWIERNFADVDAVRDVVANIQFFGRETADFPEFRLNAPSAPFCDRFWLKVGLSSSVICARLRSALPKTSGLKSNRS